MPNLKTCFEELKFKQMQALVALNGGKKKHNIVCVFYKEYRQLYVSFIVTRILSSLSKVEKDLVKIYPALMEYLRNYPALAVGCDLWSINLS